MFEANFPIDKTGVIYMPSEISIKSGAPGQGGILQRLRLVSGLILFAYALGHFLNHAMGHISLDAMTVVQFWRKAIWQFLPMTIVLYGAFAVHIALVLWKFMQRRTLKMPLWEAGQIVLGLAIPYWLITHIIYTRGVEQRLGIDMNYATEFVLLWPWVAWKQSLLLLIVWVHGCIGIHFWLSMNRWYGKAFPAILSAMVAVPGLAISGWITAARRHYDGIVGEAARGNDQLLNDNFAFIDKLIREMSAIDFYSRITVLAILGLAVLYLAGQMLRARFRNQIRIDYGDGKVVQALPGQTLLEVSRSHSIPHMSVCGGRARCSTCRTLILEGSQHLSEPTDAEKKLLSRLNAPPDIRLACQSYASGNVRIRPLVPTGGAGSVSQVSDPLGWGVERDIAVLFLDIRGFSRISEQSLPYDVVFILNSFFSEIVNEIEAENGYVDKIMGDGLMALFGLRESAEQASGSAMRAGIRAHKAAARSSAILTQHLQDPIRIGVGVHTGNAVVGRIGRLTGEQQATRLTAIGDTVNIAARLEQATKELKAGLVVSRQTMREAGIGEFMAGQSSEITVRNISKPVEITAFSGKEELAQLMAVLVE